MTITLHNPCLRLRTSLLRAGLILVSAVGLLAPSLARADVTLSVDKGQNSSQHKVDSTAANSGDSGGGGGKKGKGGGGTSTTDTVTGSIFYTITVRNLLPNTASGVTVEYHFYNKTTTSGSGSSTATVDDITNSQTFDLPGSGTKIIESSDIPTGSTNSASSGGGGGKKKGGGGGGTASSSFTVTDVMGWVIYIKKGDRVVHTYTSDESILDAVAQIKAKNGG